MQKHWAKVSKGSNYFSRSKTSLQLSFLVSFLALSVSLPRRLLLLFLFSWILLEENETASSYISTKYSASCSGSNSVKICQNGIGKSQAVLSWAKWKPVLCPQQTTMSKSQRSIERFFFSMALDTAVAFVLDGGSHSRESNVATRRMLSWSSRKRLGVPTTHHLSALLNT